MGIISHALQSVVNFDEVKYFMGKLLCQIYQHFDDQHLVDVTFKLSNPNALVPAHRLILSAASPWFRELFNSDQGIFHQIEISEIDAVTFERLIIFCYTGKTLVNIDNVDKMLKGALLLHLEAAVSKCVDFVVDHITDYTMQRAYTLQSEAQCALLNQKIFEYEIKNFMNIVQYPEFLKFDSQKLRKLIENDYLNVQSEKDVYEAVKRWYEYDAPTRIQQLPGLIGCLRLTQFDTDFIMTNIHSLPGCHGLALETLSWSPCLSHHSDLTLEYTKPRVVQQKVLMALCVEDDFEEYRAIYKYNTAEYIWQKWIEIEMDVSEYGTILLNDNLIFVGGHRDFDTLNEVRSWNLKTKTFKQLPSMNETRSAHSLVILNEEIYAIGGERTGIGYLQSVEKYSVSNGWQYIRDMHSPRQTPGAVALNEKIYVIGGFCHGELKSVECYDPKTNIWTQCADMHGLHDMPGVCLKIKLNKCGIRANYEHFANEKNATVHNGQIFVVGGCNKAGSEAVERYDPHKNEWTKICSLNAGRWKSDCISLDNKLWAIGGHYDGDYKDYVSVYDEQNEKWIERKSMPLTGAYYCFIVPKALCT